MSDKLDLVNQLLQHIDSYVDTHGNADVKLFSIYLKDKLFEVKKGNRGETFDPANYMNYREIPEVEFSTLLTGLYRYSNRYLKQVFKDTELRSIDEFGFLASLLRAGDLSKSDLINEHLLEITTGTELIKRLIHRGLMSEFTDPKDKRTRRVSITSKGREQLFRVFEGMFGVSELIRGNLDDDELSHCLSVMAKLSHFHADIFENDRNSPLEDIYRKYLNK